DVDGGDEGSVTVTLTEAGILERRQNAVQQSIEIVRRRVDEMGTREPTIQRQGVDRILVQVPGLQDSSELRDMLNTTAKLTFHMVDETTSRDDIARGRVSPGSRILPMTDGGGQMAIRRRAIVSGENLVDSQPSFDQNGSPSVGFRFDIAGAKKFGEITRQNSGRLFAIVLDEEIISAPRIKEPILGGSGQIVGGFTVEAANNLSILLRAGALPAPLTILEERSVGPDLGADSVAAGKTASIIGFAAVIVFIVLTYGWFGVAANGALIFNIALLGGLLSIIGATLTLPGIAGVVLTVGMAVDANVLIFERIREEIRAGKNPFRAVDSGYSQALSTILDANITTLIAAIILFQFGSGPIKGFAVTLTVGIITSVFTAVTLTRLFISIWLRSKRPATLKL
ncbi:MAG: protein translocase subunit SecD, partial [Sphingomonadales bacterium]